MILPNQEVHHVPSLPQPIRIQEYAVGVFESCPTKSALKKAIKANRISVNDILAQTATMIYGGERIVCQPDLKVTPKRNFQLTLDILYEDDHLAAIHKPAGVLVSGNSFKTIVNALDQNLTPSPQEDATQPHPVHRLDFATTGVLLVGKTKSAIRSLHQLFEENKVEKTYYAITIGNMVSEGIATATIDGKPARTQFKNVESVVSERFDTLNLLLINPHSGRRHQIRKHLAGMGHPILGDRDYSEPGQLLQKKGMYLHAHSIRFDHPVSGQVLTLCAPLPQRFIKIFPEWKA